MNGSKGMAIVLITGANRGIGLELTRQYLARGDQVIAACRRASAELKDLGAEILEQLDVTCDDSVAALAERLRGRQIDRLVNNAGILERQFRVNAIGPLRVTAALRANLDRGAKVFIITSRMGSVEDNTSGGYYGY